MGEGYCLKHFFLWLRLTDKISLATAATIVIGNHFLTSSKRIAVCHSLVIVVDYFCAHSRWLLYQDPKLGLCRRREICVPRAYWTGRQITYRLAKKTAQKCPGKSWPSWNTSDVGISGIADIFIKQRPSALRQQLNWTHQINYAAYVTNLLFPKLSEHRRMREWYFRTRKTNEAIWVFQFLDLLNDFQGVTLCIMSEYLHVCRHLSRF